MTIAKKSILVASLGNMLEYYDYAIFNIFLPIIAPVFFPGRTKYDALVMGYYAVLISAIARPLGGLLFGYIGDRFGRKIALLLSIYGIAFVTLLVGILPGYASIGIAAMFILTTIRALQMLCFGGEVCGAGIYVVELANGHREGLMGSILTAMALVGSVVASLIGVILSYLNPQQPNWRLAFILGGIAGLVAIIFRRNMAESVDLTELSNKVSLKTPFIKYPRELFAGVCIGGFITMPFTTVLAYVNPMLVTKGFISNLEFMKFQFILSVIAVISLLLSGLASDKYTPSKIMYGSAIALILVAWPLCKMFNSELMGFVLIAEIIMVVINEFLLGPVNAYLKSIFPVQVRYRGAAFSFCLGMSIIGGLPLL